ncbi:hypothetical protein IE53DRAFT_156240 [Violaceomyces palustris]|uniref:Uncharacterized protein n=1 Tax=Violaceomyces palustris TaxID=1673888 RepID=A0ACD0NTQ7_9BASI|nr:hypothetical protein IE53DRAFT_156240 [Violaceomyces palustris]
MERGTETLEPTIQLKEGRGERRKSERLGLGIGKKGKRKRKKKKKKKKKSKERHRKNERDGGSNEVGFDSDLFPRYSPAPLFLRTQPPIGPFQERGDSREFMRRFVWNQFLHVMFLSLSLYPGLESILRKLHVDSIEEVTTGRRREKEKKKKKVTRGGRSQGQAMVGAGRRGGGENE